MSGAILQLISADCDIHASRRQSIADGMKPLRIAGAMTILAGVSIVDEILKVTSALA